MTPSRHNYRIMREQFDENHIIVFEEENRKNMFITFDDSATFLHDTLGITTYLNANGKIGAEFPRSKLPDDVTLWYVGVEDNCYGIEKWEIEDGFDEDDYEDESEAATPNEATQIDTEPTSEPDADNTPIQSEEIRSHITSPDIHFRYSISSEDSITRSCYNCRFQYNEDRCPYLMRPHACEEWSYKPEVNREAYNERNIRRNQRGRETNPEVWNNQGFDFWH